MPYPNPAPALTPRKQSVCSQSQSFLAHPLSVPLAMTHSVSLISCQICSANHGTAMGCACEHANAVPWLAEQIWQEIKDTEWVIANGTLKGWARKLWDWEQTDCFLGVSAGAGLGYGIGASLGVALAYKDTGRICVDLQDDGDFLFAPSALWTAGHYRLPLLIIINNNGCYYNAERHQLRVAEARNRDTGKIGVGTSLEDPRVDYAMLAKSFGIYA